MAYKTNFLQAAVDARIAQLKRQVNAAANPLIKEILNKEIEELILEFGAVKNAK